MFNVLAYRSHSQHSAVQRTNNEQNSQTAEQTSAYNSENRFSLVLTGQNW